MYCLHGQLTEWPAAPSTSSWLAPSYTCGGVVGETPWWSLAKRGPLSQLSVVFGIARDSARAAGYAYTYVLRTCTLTLLFYFW